MYWEFKTNHEGLAMTSTQVLTCGRRELWQVSEWRSDRADLTWLLPDPPRKRELEGSGWEACIL